MRQKRYLWTNTYKDISSLKEDSLDKWNNLDESYSMYQTDSISRSEGTLVLRMEDRLLILIKFSLILTF